MLLTNNITDTISNTENIIKLIIYGFAFLAFWEILSFSLLFLFLAFFIVNTKLITNPYCKDN